MKKRSCYIFFGFLVFAYPVLPISSNSGTLKNCHRRQGQFMNCLFIARLKYDTLVASLLIHATRPLLIKNYKPYMLVRHGLFEIFFYYLYLFPVFQKSCKNTIFLTYVCQYKEK